MKREKRVNCLLIAISFMIYAINIWFKKQEISYRHLFIRNHLNDLIAPVVVLAFAGILLNYINKQSIGDFSLILLICAFCSFIWEYCALVLHPASTFDYIDIVCIFCGGIIYWSIYNILIKRKEK